MYHFLIDKFHTFKYHVFNQLRSHYSTKYNIYLQTKWNHCDFNAT